MKNLTLRIAASDRKKWLNPKTSRLAVLKKMQNEILEAIDFGWSLKTVWDHLIFEKILTYCSYDTFLNTWKALRENAQLKETCREENSTPEKNFPTIQ